MTDNEKGCPEITEVDFARKIVKQVDETLKPETEAELPTEDFFDVLMMKMDDELTRRDQYDIDAQKSAIKLRCSINKNQERIIVLKRRMRALSVVIEELR